MDKEREIEKVVDILVKHIMLEHKAFTDNIVGEWNAAKAIVEAGYRKADEVRKETAKEILYYLKATITDGLLKNHEILNALIKKYDIEVD